MKFLTDVYVHRWKRGSVSVLPGVQVELRDRRGRQGDRVEQGLPRTDRIRGSDIGGYRQAGDGGEEVNLTKF